VDVADLAELADLGAPRARQLALPRALLLATRRALRLALPAAQLVVAVQSPPVGLRT